MITVARTIVAGAALLTAPACGPTADPGDDTSTSTTSDASSPTDTSADVPTTHDGSLSTSSDGSTSSGDVSDTGTCEASTGGPDAACPIDVPECSLEHQVCVLAPGPFEDCGTLELSDDVALWQAAQACVLAATSEQRAFQLVSDLVGMDSFQTLAHVGHGSCPLLNATVHFDDDPCGGRDCGPVVTVTTCASFTAKPDCTIEPGDLCLRCDGPTQATQVCKPD